MMTSLGDRPPRYFNFALLAITLVCLIPILSFATSQFVEYDGYMHVWIAQQDRWANFLREYQSDAHPPLYYLLLRLTLALGRTQLVYRSLSLISGAGSIFVFGRTALRILRSPAWAALSTLAYGLALPTILLANEVRAYMLAAFLVQVSFYYFLDLIGEQQPASVRSRVLFAVTASLACLNEYYAVFYIGGVLVLAFAIPIVRRSSLLKRDLLREAMTFALILALPVAEYLSHIGARTVAYDHLPAYYFQPDSGESAVGFLLRNLRNELNCFSPLPVPEGPVFYTVLAVLLAAAGVVIFLVRRSDRPKNLPALVSLLLPLLMLFALMAGSLVRGYPFGGFLRQQFILFPFFIICVFLLPDRLLAGVPRTAALAAVGIVGIGVIALSARSYQAWPKDSRLLLSDQMGRYNRLFPAAQAVYIDQFNVTTFFMHHHDWQWEFAGLIPGSTVDTYRLSKDNRSMMLFRDRDDWILDLRDPRLYNLMARGMRNWHLSSMTIFDLAQQPGKTRTEAQVTAYLARIAELSATEGLCVQTLDLDNYDVYAEFRTSGLCRQ